MKELVLTVAVIVIIYVILPFVLKVINRTPSDPEKMQFPYHSKYILTNNEYRFYTSLKPLMDAKSYLICPKVGLKDLFEVNAGTTERQKYFAQISQKHIDFLVCDRELRPLFAIELDDNSHKRAEVKKRDRFKDQLFESVGFPLYRVPIVSEFSEDFLYKHITFNS